MRFFAYAVVALLFVACESSSAHKIKLRLVTDIVPGIETTTAVARVTAHVGSEIVVIDPVQTALTRDMQLVRGVQVADVAVPSGEYNLSIELLRPDGTRLVERTVIASISKDQTVTIQLTANCIEVDCSSGASGSVPRTCVDGTCVDQRCTPETPGYCPDSLICDKDTACPASAVSCAQSECNEGICLDVPRDNACTSAQYCSLIEGCIDVPATQQDGGVPSSDASIVLDSDVPDAMADIDAALSTDASVATDGRVADAALDAPRDARADAPRDARADAPPDATPDAAPTEMRVLLDDRSSASAILAEFGTSLAYKWSATLSRAPSRPARVTFTMTDPSEAQFSTGDTYVLYFDSSNWNTNQTVHLYAADDDLNDYDQTQTIGIVYEEQNDHGSFDPAPHAETTAQLTTVDDEGVQRISRYVGDTNSGNALYTQPRYPLAFADISDDGAYIAYSSTRSDRSCSTSVIQLHLRRNFNNVLVSKASATAGYGCPNGSSWGPSLAAGSEVGTSVVAYTSDASNLVDDDTNGYHDVFVTLPWSDITERVSVSSSGEQANADSASIEISNDGRYVLFMSQATNLVDQTDVNTMINGGWDFFLHDRMTAETTLVSRSSDRLRTSSTPLYSAGAFSDDSTQLLVDVTYGSDVVGGGIGGYFVYDIATDAYISTVATNYRMASAPRWSQTGPVIVSSGGLFDLGMHTLSPVPAATGCLSLPSGCSIGPYDISGSGNAIAFEFTGGEFTADDRDEASDVFYYDLLHSTMTRISHTYDGAAPNGASRMARFSRDGRWVIFISSASNLTPDGGGNDLFVWKVE